MRIIITEQQNEQLKKYSAIKEIVDSFSYNALEKTDFDLNYRNEYGFYEIIPTFYMNQSKLTAGEAANMKLLKLVMRNELVQKIEDFLGIHITSPRSSIEWIK